MAYVKISDPKIIDLPTVHQIINVVNQHSDNISAITNNFGSIYTGSNTSGASTEYQYDISSQQIVYGVTTFNNGTDKSAGITYSDTLGTYTIPVNVSPSFGSTPIIIAQVQVTTSSPTYQDLIVDVSSPTINSFNLILKRASLTKTDWLKSNVKVNWVAIGKK